LIRILNPRLLSCIASCDVASNIFLARARNIIDIHFEPSFLS